MSGLDPQSHHEHQVFLGKQFGDGWMAGTNVDASSIYGPVLFMLALPFMAARWLVDHVGWIGLILVVLALVVAVRFLAFHPRGRVLAARISGLAVGAILGFLAAGILYLGWQFAGLLLSN